MTTLVHNWEDGPMVRRFIHSRLVGMRENTIREYERAISRWTDYIYKERQLSPKEIDYARFEPVTVWDHTVYQPISRVTVERFLDTLPTTASVFRTRSRLHVYFSYLVEFGHLPSNPVQKPDYRNANRGRTRSLPIEELHRLFRVIQKEPIFIRAPLVIQAASGLRVSELTALQIDDIERLPGGLVVYIRHGQLKSHKPLARPLPRVDAVLGEYMAWRRQLTTDTDLLFLTPNQTPWTTPGINAVLARLGETAGCHRKVTSHDLRRGYAAMLSKGIGHSEITRQLFDHQEPATTQFYTAIPNLSEVRENLFRLGCVRLANRLATALLAGKGDETRPK